MSLSLAQARAKVRVRTRHVGDTVRLTDTNLDIILNDVYRELRTELQSLAPKLYVVTSSDQVVTAGGTISPVTISTTFEQVYLLQRLNEVNEWDSVASANTYDPRQHAMGCSEERPKWERRGSVIVLHPEGEVAGTFRLMYYNTPADLVTGSPSDPFLIPVTTENVLVARACAQVTEDDGNDSAVFIKRADRLRDAAASALWKEYGITPDLAGFMEVLGY